MSKEIYNRLEIPIPGPLRKDGSEYAKSNIVSAESLHPFADVRLLKLKMAQLRVLPKFQKRILQEEKEPPGRACEEVRLG